MAARLKTYLVLYDLAENDRDYGPLFRVIHSLEAYARPLDCVWVVQTRFSLDRLARALSLRLGTDDRLLVVECGNHGAWRRMEPQIWSWLQEVFVQPTRDVQPVPLRAVGA